MNRFHQCLSLGLMLLATVFSPTRALAATAPLAPEQPFLGNWYAIWNDMPIIFQISIAKRQDKFTVDMLPAFPPIPHMNVMSGFDVTFHDGGIEFFQGSGMRAHPDAPMINRLYLYRLVPAGEDLLVEGTDVRLARNLAPLIAAMESAPKPDKPAAPAEGEKQPDISPTKGLGQLAPELRAASWVRGEPVTLAAERGKRAVLVVFWHSSLLYYGGSLAQLERMAQKHAEDAVVVVLAPEDPERLDQLLEEELHIRLGIDSHASCQREMLSFLGMSGMPTAVLVDRDGRFAWAGHQADSQLEKALEEVCSHKQP